MTGLLKKISLSQPNVLKSYLSVSSTGSNFSFFMKNFWLFYFVINFFSYVRHWTEHFVVKVLPKFVFRNHWRNDSGEGLRDHFIENIGSFIISDVIFNINWSFFCFFLIFRVKKVYFPIMKLFLYSGLSLSW